MRKETSKEQHKKNKCKCGFFLSNKKINPETVIAEQLNTIAIQEHTILELRKRMQELEEQLASKNKTIAILTGKDSKITKIAHRELELVKN